ncbi:cyclin-dependent kinase inhibitor 5-like isoform X1 [Juglans microcarpa x Juglans regia]|uniref:cyclin-dependent kinase inhibitor 5-like isoform X1 n=1 Tax=Juglans microcarpa x Juglans regia TaxID=2249226 RepID=UPI001B7F6AB2|nr:cyclin-dependent kinase inhibitor 5-like isoform X1 [Juglans microcarpa x Juglans regia]
MGKYIRKAKTTGEVAVMEVSQSSLGVRTRARTLALLESPATPSPTTDTGSVSYLQLRSRRLQKPPIVLSGHGSVPKRHKQGPNYIESCAQQQNKIPDMDNSIPKSNPRSGSRLRAASASDGPVSPGPLEEEEAKKVVGGAKEEGLQGKKKKSSKNNNGDLGLEEASFGENVLEFEGRERSTRESTPCSLIRDPDTIRTPCSTTRPSGPTKTNGRTQNITVRHIPTTQEMDDFFAASVEEQRRQFIEKYNFDPVNDKPLPGRYEWVKLDL